MTRRFPLGAVFRGALVLAAACMAADSPADTLIDSFDNRSTVAPWTFSNGPEFPGASGSLSLGTGYSGQGAHLSYDFSKGGSYVGAFLNLATPISAAAISFWVRSPADISVTLRVTDSTGQTLQYLLCRPVSASTDPTAWYQQIVALDGPSLWYSGANDGVLHNPIKTIGVLAGSPAIAYPVDSIDFDEVTAVSSTAYTLNPQAGLVPGPAGSGNLLSGMGVAIHFTQDSTALDAASSAGFAWVRTDLTWSAVEQTANVYNWGPYDALISAVQSRGMHAILILDYGNALYTGGFSTPPSTDAAINAYGNFAQAAAEHFAGTGTRFEIWNEPNISKFWPPDPDPAQFAAMATVAVARIHQGDPNAMVTTAGLSGFDFSFAQGLVSAGGVVGADAIGIHPYGISNPAGPLVDDLVLFQSVMGGGPSGSPPVWDTEWGFSSTDYSPAGTSNGHDPGAQARQAVLVSREMLSACAVGFPLYVYYDIKDDGTDPTNREDNFGLLGSDYADKPAMTAVRTLAAVAGARTFSGFIPTSTTGLVAMRFDGAADETVALWEYSPNSTVTVTVPAGARVTDLYGHPVALQGSSLAVTEAAGPVYVRIPTDTRITNLSVRSNSGAASAQLIAGFSISGGSKTVLIRGDGPSLSSFGLSEVLQDVNLILLNSAGTVIGQNNGWGGTAALTAAFAQVGAFSFSASSLDSALLENLGPGSYTAEVVGAGDGTGIALAEIYDADLGSTPSRLTNASARTMVGTGINAPLVGFVLNGGGTEQLLVRAIGPGLAQFGVTGALTNPVLTIYDGSQHAIATNSGWGGAAALASAFSQVGAFALQPTSADSAMLISLPSGSYTAQVTGLGGSSGVALIELYEMPGGN